MNRVSSLVAVLFCLLVPSLAWAKYTPPPLTGHVVTTAGWLSPADIRGLNEMCELLHTQTGYVVDVLVADKLGDASVQDAANETFQTWKPADPKKDNGILLFLAPNFPVGERKARIVAGTDVALTEAKAKEILFGVLEPKINGSDVRAAVAESLAALDKAFGGDLSKGKDAGAAAGDAGAATGAAPSPASSDDSSGLLVWGLVGVLVVAVGFAFVRTRGANGDGAPKS
jgi:uncharacterized protein